MKFLPTKAICVVGALLFIGWLIFRIVDLGVTINYLEASIQSESAQAQILERFQRTKCLDISEIPSEFMAFKKGGAIFINSVRFECIWVDELERRLFVHTAGHKRNFDGKKRPD